MSNPTTHPDARRLADYRAGRLSAPETLDVSDHLMDCAACRAMLPVPPLAEVTGGRKIDLPAILPDGPPDYEEMAASLDGILDAAQCADVRARLAASPEATEVFTGLQRFRDEIAALPPKTHGPAQTSGLAGCPAGNTRPAAGKLVIFPSRRRALWAAVAAAALVLLSAGWWLAGGTNSRGTGPLWADADLSGLPGDLRRGVEHAAQTGTVEMPPLLAQLSPLRGTLAGAVPKPAPLRQIAPVGVVVREDRPALRWTAAQDATGYVVYLADADGRLPVLRQEVPGGTTSWTPRSPLARGSIFEWQVEARRGGEVLARAPRPPEPEARFQVLDERADGELAGLERRYPTNALILGTAYAHAGLVEAAEKQFEKLARSFPKSRAAERLAREAQGRLTVNE